MSILFDETQDKCGIKSIANMYKDIKSYGLIFCLIYDMLTYIQELDVEVQQIMQTSIYIN